MSDFGARAALWRRPLAVAVGLVVMLVQPFSPAGGFFSVAAAQEQVVCGQTITRTVTLANDLTNCSGDGLVIGADNITVDLNGKTVDGVGLGVGIRNDGYHNVAITNGTVQEFDYGVALKAAASNFVTYLTLTRNEFAGVQLTDSDQNQLLNNTIDRQGNDGIVLLADSNANSVRNNTISSNGGTGLFVHNSIGNLFQFNNIATGADRGVLLEGSSNNTLVSNMVSNNSDSGISLQLGSNNNTLHSNTITGNGDAGLVVSDSEGTQILSNTIRQSGDSGIFLERSNGSTIKDNNISLNPGGIELNSSNRNLIQANTVNQSGGTGIELEDAADNDIRSNSIVENGAQGIRVEGEIGSGVGNRIDGNMARANRGGGIVVAAGGHTISQNAANNNAGWGIYVAGGNVDGGANVASDNAEPAQCFGIVCNEPALACPGTAVIAADADSWIDQNSVNSNFGADSVLKVRSKSPDSNVRALVRFRLPAMPVGCQVSDARLQLHAASATTGRTLQAWQLDGSWTESGVTWFNQPAETIGAPATAPSALGTVEWNVTAQVQAMYAGTNNGFLIRDADEGHVASPEQSFHSREKTSDPQPALVITLQ
jgi:parallel beta-helix repeat protein